MKRNFFKLLTLCVTLTTVTFFVACEKEETADPIHEGAIETTGVMEIRAPKIDVCHYDEDDGTWHVINISQNAWAAHAAHGDVRLDDQDDDGYVPDNECGFGNMGDCDDNDASISPGAPEVCDEIDNNCDGNVDEGVTTTFYADADDDGYGDASSSVEACSAPGGHVENDTDCNDGDVAINPAAEEVCGNEIDDNCDGNVDEDCSGGGLEFTVSFPCPSCYTPCNGGTKIVHSEVLGTGVTWDQAVTLCDGLDTPTEDWRLVLSCELWDILNAYGPNPPWDTGDNTFDGSYGFWTGTFVNANFLNTPIAAAYHAFGGSNAGITPKSWTSRAGEPLNCLCVLE